MKAMGTRFFLLFLILINLASSIDFSMDSPEKVTNSEEFAVRILEEAENSEIYDVKIFVSNNDKIVSQIYNDGWKNSRYYIREVFPGKREFNIKILEEGNFEICARLRKSGKTAFDEKCNKINVETEKINEENTDEKDKVDNQDKNGVEEKKKEEKETKQVVQSVENLNLKKENIEERKELKEEKIEKIILNRNLKNENDGVFLTNYGKRQEYIVYSFLAFCVFLIILLALKKI